MGESTCACGVALEGRLGRAYNEEAFRHLLSVERRRAAHTCHSFLLLLVSLKRQAGHGSGIPTPVAAHLFSELWLGLRDGDMVGWYRQGRVAGAVLAHGDDPPAPDVASRIGDRIAEALRRRVPADIARRLQVRVLQLRPVRRS